MAAANINKVIITGNLTKDPELRTLPSGFSICSMRVAVNGRKKGQDGTWVDKPGYFDVVAFGAQAENAAKYLSKGRPIAVDGRLEWREWEAKDGSGKRQAVEIAADNIQFLGSASDNGSRPAAQAPAAEDPTDAFAATGFADAPADDDIPF